RTSLAIVKAWSSVSIVMSCSFCGPSMRAAVEFQALFHPRHLLRRGLGLIFRLPFILRHAVDRLARGSLVAFVAGVANPVCQAIAAESGEAHQVDVLRIVAMAQMAHQSAKRLCGHRIGQLVERV